MTKAGERTGAGEELIAWYEGRSVSYEAAAPYSPFVDLLNAYFGFGPGWTDADKYDAVKAHIADLSPHRVDEIAPFIATLLGVQLPDEDERVRYLQPPQVRGRIFEATCELFERLAERQPLVLVFEDLHWFDPTSIDLVERLMEITDRAALMVLGLFRPWRQELSWRFHETAVRDYAHRYTPLALEPLDNDCSWELVANLLHVEDLPEKVRQLIMTKAEGNPFFVEEVIRSLLDTGLVIRENSHWRATQDIETLAVPDRLAGVITARLDRLDEESKRVAQSASVIGREFQFETLADVHGAQQTLDNALTELQRRELILEGGRLPHQDFLFKHALTQETAYGSLLLSRRRELHSRVAECIERIQPDRVGEIAWHFLEAREESRALPYLIDAADRAAGAYSTTEAIKSYTRALEILDTVKDSRLARRAYEGLGGAMTFGGEIPGAVENYHKMLQVAEDQNDLPMQVSALNKLGFVTALMQGQFRQAEEHLENAGRLAVSCDDLPGMAELHMTYCYLRVPFGMFDDAVEHLNESARIGRDLQLEEPRLFGMAHIANTLTYMTRFDEAWEVAQEARQLAEELGNRKWQAALLALPSPLYHIRIWDLDTALREAEEGSRIAAQIGAAEEESDGSLMQGQIHWMRGEYEKAIACHQTALRAGRAAGSPFLEAAALCGLGTAYLDIGGEYSQEGVDLHSQAMEVLEKPLGNVMGTMIWADMGLSALAMGELGRAGDLLRNGLASSDAMKFLARPPLLVGSAFLALARHDTEEAGKLAQEAREFSEEREMRHFYPLVAFADAQISAVRGETEPALEKFSQAEHLALEMRMRPLVWQVRAGAAQALAASGRSGEADARRHQARAMIDEIAGLFQDDGLRNQYVESTTRKLG